jgi:transposase
MATRGGPVHVVTTSRSYKGREYHTHLLRRSYREGGRVRNETLGNLSHLPEDLIDVIRRSLKGERFVAAEQAFQITESLAHGHVSAVRRAMQRLGFDALIASQPSRERDLVCAMVAARVLDARTKLATTRWWETTTLADDFGVAGADVDELYAAMDWLLQRQNTIERKLARRHLEDGGLVLYDVSSSYFEGSTCPLARIGYSRDGRKNTPQVVYGLVTDVRGCPVAVSVHEGNTADSKTLLPQVQRVRDKFGINQFVVVGDRGMLSQASIDSLRAESGLEWITALKSVQIRTLVEDGTLQLGLFDQRSLFELTHPDFPGERLVACRNPALAERRAHKRRELLDATVKQLTALQARVTRAKNPLRGEARIGLCAGRVINRYKVAKHIVVEIGHDRFDFRVDEEVVRDEAALDGLYVIRSGLPQASMDTDELVRSYKQLANVERAFRSLKTVDLKVRPIHHRLADRVKSHILLCMLAYYVEWHMKEAWRPLLFADEDLAAKSTRDPVAPAQRSEQALSKVRSRALDDSSPVHSFRTLLSDLATIVRNTCRTPGTPDSPTFQLTTQTTPTQQRAFDLLASIGT